ncbi:MAG: hypothetical protein ACREOZ_01105, partial [Gloeomargaritales cyanobacterium]
MKMHFPPRANTMSLMNTMCTEAGRVWKKVRLDEITNAEQLQTIAGVYRFGYHQQCKIAKSASNNYKSTRTRLEQVEEEQSNQAKVNDITEYTRQVELEILKQAGMYMIFKK